MKNRLTQKKMDINLNELNQNELKSELAKELSVAEIKNTETDSNTLKDIETAIHAVKLIENDEKLANRQLTKKIISAITELKALNESYNTLKRNKLINDKIKDSYQFTLNSPQVHDLFYLYENLEREITKLTINNQLSKIAKMKIKSQYEPILTELYKAFKLKDKEIAEYVKRDSKYVQMYLELCDFNDKYHTTTDNEEEKEKLSWEDEEINDVYKLFDLAN